MRWIRKAVILGLAALGAQRLYELLRPRATQLKERVTPPVEQAIGIARETTAEVTDAVRGTAGGVKETATDVAQSVADAAAREREQAERIGDEVRAAAGSGTPPAPMRPALGGRPGA
jgi:hypothetical protein